MNSKMIFNIILGNQQFQLVVMLKIVSFDIQGESTLQWPPLGCIVILIILKVTLNNNLTHTYGELSQIVMQN